MCGCEIPAVTAACWARHATATCLATCARSRAFSISSTATTSSCACTRHLVLLENRNRSSAAGDSRASRSCLTRGYSPHITWCTSLPYATIAVDVRQDANEGGIFFTSTAAEITSVAPMAAWGAVLLPPTGPPAMELPLDKAGDRDVSLLNGAASSSCAKCHQSLGISTQQHTTDGIYGARKPTRAHDVLQTYRACFL